MIFLYYNEKDSIYQKKLKKKKKLRALIHITVTFQYYIILSKLYKITLFISGILSFLFNVYLPYIIYKEHLILILKIKN